MSRILTLTISPTVDTSTHVEAVVPERKLRCAQPVSEPGGGGVNVAHALRRFGVDATAMITAGGRTGQLLIDMLNAEGIAMRVIPIREFTRENVTVREDATTLQYRFCMPGPTLQTDEWDAIVRELESVSPAPDFFVLSGSMPPGLPDDAYAELVRIARDRGSRVIVDTSGPPLKSALEAGVFLVKPNLSELASLEGDRWIEDDVHLRAAARRLVTEHNAVAAVVSLGAAGALAVTRDGMMRIPAPAVPQQSKVGAGDSMVAGIVWGLAQDWSVFDAAVLGVAAGAAAVMTPGTELCSREDTERLYAQARQQNQFRVA